MNTSGNIYFQGEKRTEKLYDFFILFSCNSEYICSNNSVRIENRIRIRDDQAASPLRGTRRTANEPGRQAKIRIVCRDAAGSIQSPKKSDPKKAVFISSKKTQRRQGPPGRFDSFPVVFQKANLQTSIERNNHARNEKDNDGKISCSSYRRG